MAEPSTGAPAPSTQNPAPAREPITHSPLPTTGAPAPEPITHNPSPATCAPGAPAPARKARRALWLLLVIAAVIGSVFLVRWFLASRGFDWHAFGATLLALEWWWLSASAVAVFAGYYGRALRWRVLMRPVKPKPSLWNLFSATVIGFSAITLLGRPGEFVRPYLIAAKEKVSASSQMAALVLERIYDVLIVLAIFGFALSRVRRSDARLGPALSWVFATGGWFVALLSVVVLGLLIAFRHFSASMRQRLLAALSALPERQFQRADRLITAFVQGVESTKSQKAMLLVVWYTVFEWATITVTVYCVMRAFGRVLHFGWLDVLIFLGFLAFGAVVQIPGVGGGTQVISVLVLTELFRIPLEISTSVAIVLWVVSFVVVIPIGLALALREGINWRSLRQLEPEVSV